MTDQPPNTPAPTPLPAESWLSSRTNVTALIVGIGVLASVWGAKFINLSQEARDALVTLIVGGGVPLIIYFRTKARRLLEWWRK